MGTFDIVDINYILFIAYSDVIVPYNCSSRLDIRPFGPLRVSEASMGPKLCISFGFGAGILWLQTPINGEVHSAPFERMDSGF